jgi:type II secretory pathway pseudopilin PulG
VPASSTVPKGFKLNPAPPNGPPPGKSTHDNEWLSDREREQEREERLANAARAAAEQAQHQHQHATKENSARPSTAAVRRPADGQGGARPFSSKPVRDQHGMTPYATRTGSQGPPITVQAYANNVASRSPSRSASSGVENVARTASASSSKFVSKVKDATSAVAEEIDQKQQRIGAPSAQMLYPTAFKGSRYANALPITIPTHSCHRVVARTLALLFSRSPDS